jgi:serine/threonine protein kinase
MRKEAINTKNNPNPPLNHSTIHLGMPCSVLNSTYTIKLLPDFLFLLLQVAIKIVSKGKIKVDSYIRKNLRREGKLLQLLRHPNIVKLLDIMETENSYYLVMEYCKGGDLMEYICQKQRLEEKEVKRLIRQVISAVDYLHRMGILHR